MSQHALQSEHSFMCVCVFKLYAHYTTCDNSVPAVRRDCNTLWCVCLRGTLSSLDNTLSSTCRFIIRLGQQTLGTQREVNVKQIVYLPHCWRASALFARRIRHTLAQRSAETYPFRDCFQTSDTLEMWFVWIVWYLKNFNFRSASNNQIFWIWFHTSELPEIWQEKNDNNNGNDWKRSTQVYRLI